MAALNTFIVWDNKLIIEFVNKFNISCVLWVTFFSVLQVCKDVEHPSPWLLHPGLLNTEKGLQANLVNAQIQSELPTCLLTAALLGLLWQLLSQRQGAGYRLVSLRQGRPSVIAVKDYQTLNKQYYTFIAALWMNSRTKDIVDLWLVLWRILMYIVCLASDSWHCFPLQ